MSIKKYLGQHFLTAPHYAQRIAAAVPAARGDTVVEIGAGTGALSVHLAARFARLHLVEKDRDVIPRLLEKLGENSVVLHQADALEFAFDSLGVFHAAGNLPYGVAAPIIRRVLYCAPLVRSCTFMVQREVAERIVAGPHTRTNGFLSVFCQFFGTPRVVMHVPPGAFFPRPRVDSSVFVLEIDQRLERRVPRNRWDEFFAFVDCGYSMRRKKVVNPLRRRWPEHDFGGLMRVLGLAQGARAEDLTVDNWVALFQGAFGC